MIPRINRLTLEVRQFFPKGTDLSGITQTELNDVARLMNQRPRKTLGWKTPEEAMAEELAAFRSTVALEPALFTEFGQSGCVRLKSL